MQTILNLNIFTIETCDTVQSRKSGFQAVVVSAQDTENGWLFELVRTDTGETAILFDREIELVKKASRSFTGFSVSEETASRARSCQEAVNQKAA